MRAQTYAPCSGQAREGPAPLQVGESGRRAIVRLHMQPGVGGVRGLGTALAVTDRSRRGGRAKKREEFSFLTQIAAKARKRRFSLIFLLDTAAGVGVSLALHPAESRRRHQPKQVERNAP
jgi:hypothetical protein